MLSNHDVIRHASRLALETPVAHGDGIGPKSPELPDRERGLRRARCATLLMLALPGCAYLYNGEEPGLPDVIEIADEERENPTWERSGHSRYGRDGCRVLLPWAADAPALGFSTQDETRLPQPPYWAEYARDVQTSDPNSTLNLYRQALQVRSQNGLGSGTVQWQNSDPDVIAFQNGAVTVLASFGTKAVALPQSEVLVASAPIEDGILPAEATVGRRSLPR